MTPEYAAEQAADALAKAAASCLYPEQAAALVRVADGWTRLLTALANAPKEIEPATAAPRISVPFRFDLNPDGGVIIDWEEARETLRRLPSWQTRPYDPSDPEDRRILEEEIDRHYEGMKAASEHERELTKHWPRISNDFGWALRMLLQGEKVTRNEWTPDCLYVTLVRDDPHGRDVHIAQVRPDGDSSSGKSHEVWLPSMTDLLADDWRVA